MKILAEFTILNFMIREVYEHKNNFFVLAKVLLVN